MSWPRLLVAIRKCHGGSPRPVAILGVISLLTAMSSAQIFPA